MNIHTKIIIIIYTKSRTLTLHLFNRSIGALLVLGISKGLPQSSTIDFVLLPASKSSFWCRLYGDPFTLSSLIVFTSKNPQTVAGEMTPDLITNFFFSDFLCNISHQYKTKSKTNKHINLKLNPNFKISLGFIALNTNQIKTYLQYREKQKFYHIQPKKNIHNNILYTILYSL